MGDELRGESLVHLNVRFSTETELKAIQDMLYEKSGQGVSFTGLVEKQRQNAAAGNPYGTGQNHTGMCAANHRTNMRSEILSAQLRLPPLPGTKARNPGHYQCNQCRV